MRSVFRWLQAGYVVGQDIPSDSPDCKPLYCMVRISTISAFIFYHKQLEGNSPSFTLSKGWETSGVKISISIEPRYP